MKVGIMQPYFFPYLGYWQLMAAVDCYVVYDDVNYINRGRINRNAILINGAAKNINLHLSAASQNKLINEINVAQDYIYPQKLLRTLEMAYRRAPYFFQVYPLLEEIITQAEDNLAEYLFRSFEVVNNYLGIRTRLVRSSAIEKDNSLKAYRKVINICEALSATEYYNSINGVPLYEPHRAEFEKAGIHLMFLQMDAVEYKQFNNEFVPNLSIIDVMMFNSKDKIQEMLNCYRLV